MDYQFDHYCFTIGSDDLHQFESYLLLLSCTNILCSLNKRGGLKINFEMGISNLCFRQYPQQVNLCPLHCDVEFFACDG